MAIEAFFLDTAYVYALFNTCDQWHEKAAEWEEKITPENRPLVTTEFVLTEIANGLSAPKFRRHAAAIIRSLETSPLVKVVPASSELFAKALTLLRTTPGQRLGLDRLRLVRRDDGKQFDRCSDHRRTFSTSRI